MKSLDAGPGGDSQDGIDDLLDGALGTHRIEPARLETMRAAVEAEWRAATAQPAPRGSTAPRPRRWYFAAAAAVAAAALVPWLERSPAPQPIVASISRLDGPAVQVRTRSSLRRLGAGDPLRAGDAFTAPGTMLVALSRGGTLRIGKGTAISMTAGSELSLSRGSIYVDVPHGTANPLRVSTVAGTIDHIGTEFEVISDADVVKVRVREGRIRFARKDGGALDAPSGTQLEIAPGSAISRTTIDTYGPEWQWADALAPDFEIEGRPLLAFLERSSRETGRPLEFADTRSREIAERTVLHGSVRGQTPAEALTHVLMSTSLTLDPQPGVIRVRSTH